MNTVWLRRIRGKGFHYTTQTLWHHEDANAIRIAQSRKGTLRVGTCIMPCGGPESKPPFYSVWPEMYPSSFLRATYNAMRDPRKYAATFMCNPQPDEMRKVKELGYFLREIPDTPGPYMDWAVREMEKHRAFLQSAVYYISIDPSATSNDTSDRACFIYAAVGDLVTSRKTDVGIETESRRVARILDARQFHATQTECVDEVATFSSTNKVDYIICETRSGFNAMKEIFYTKYGLDIISYDPKNRKKILRLQDVAPMIDARLMARGWDPPVIEFPGKIQSQSGGVIQLAPDDEFLWLALQILDAGMCSEDHALDAVTQFAKHIGPEMGFGMGAVTHQIHDAVDTSPSQRAAAKMLEAYSVPTPTDNVAREDFGFSMGWSQ